MRSSETIETRRRSDACETSSPEIFLTGWRRCRLRRWRASRRLSGPPRARGVRANWLHSRRCLSASPRQARAGQAADGHWRPSQPDTFRQTGGRARGRLWGVAAGLGDADGNLGLEAEEVVMGLPGTKRRGQRRSRAIFRFPPSPSGPGAWAGAPPTAELLVWLIESRLTMSSTLHGEMTLSQRKGWYHNQQAPNKRGKSSVESTRPQCTSDILS